MAFRKLENTHRERCTLPDTYSQRKIISEKRELKSTDYTKKTEIHSSIICLLSVGRLSLCCVFMFYHLSKWRVFLTHLITMQQSCISINWAVLLSQHLLWWCITFSLSISYLISALISWLYCFLPANQFFIYIFILPQFMMRWRLIKCSSNYLLSYWS